MTIHLLKIENLYLNLLIHCVKNKIKLIASVSIFPFCQVNQRASLCIIIKVSNMYFEFLDHCGRLMPPWVSHNLTLKYFKLNIPIIDWKFDWLHLHMKDLFEKLKILTKAHLSARVSGCWSWPRVWLLSAGSAPRLTSGLWPWAPWSAPWWAASWSSSRRPGTSPTRRAASSSVSASTRRWRTWRTSGDQRPRTRWDSEKVQSVY